VALSIGLIVLRDPRYFTQPRFWAEEGMLHFAFSYNHGGLAALFQPQMGYLNFWPNLATLLATLAPLQTAPLVTTLMALAVQLLLVALIFWSRSPLWQGWWRKALGAAVVLFVPLTAEVWLNSVNSYTYFAVIAFLLLIEDPPTGRIRQWLYRILLVLSGLTGTLACFLTLLFFVQAWAEKKAERVRQALILAACSLVQIWLILGFRGAGSFSQRFKPVGLTMLGGTVWAQSLGLLAAGLDGGHIFGSTLLGLMKTNPSAYQWLGCSLLAAAVILIFLLSASLPRRTRWMFLASYTLLLVLTLSFSIVMEKSTYYNTGWHQRLFLAPNILFGWMLLANFCIPPAPERWTWLKRTSRILSAALLAAAFFWGLQTFWQPWVPDTAWPDWRQEVRAWRSDPGHALEIQPAGQGWFVHLDRQ
jgi:hypothetical protein